jgi:hypothetical protein
VTLARHRRVDQQATNPESADVDVEIGEQGSVGIALPQLRQAPEPRLRNFERADVDMILEIGEGPPVELRTRRDEEGALGILQAQIVNDELAVDGAFEPADVDVEAGRHLQIVDLLGDVAPSQLGVDAEIEAGNQQRDRGDGDGDADGDTLQVIGALAHRRLGRLLLRQVLRGQVFRRQFAGHQKA